MKKRTDIRQTKCHGCGYPIDWEYDDVARGLDFDGNIVYFCSIVCLNNYIEGEEDGND